MISMFRFWMTGSALTRYECAGSCVHVALAKNIFRKGRGLGRGGQLSEHVEGWRIPIPPSYALAMLCQPGLAIAKAIASWDHRHHGFARALDIPTLIAARSLR